MVKTYIIDIYAEMDAVDDGEEFEIEPGSVRCRETGELFSGVFTIKNLKSIGYDNEEKF